VKFTAGDSVNFGENFCRESSQAVLSALHAGYSELALAASYSTSIVRQTSIERQRWSNITWQV
jgi:hypothetical protein